MLFVGNRRSGDRLLCSGNWIVLNVIRFEFSNYRRVCIDVFVKEMIGEMNTVSMIFVFNNLILIRFLYYILETWIRNLVFRVNFN